MGISVWEVIGAAGSKPYGYMPFYPGLGVGGHCIPLDPYYLASKAKEYDFHIKFIELAASINEQMPYYVTNRIMEAMNNEGKSIRDAKVLVMGITYKKDIPDIRESPAIECVREFIEYGIKVRAYDPEAAVAAAAALGGRIETFVNGYDALENADALVILTDWQEFRNPDFESITKKLKSPVIFDGRNLYDPHIVAKAGLEYHCIGRPPAPVQKA